MVAKKPNNKKAITASPATQRETFFQALTFKRNFSDGSLRKNLNNTMNSVHKWQFTAPTARVLTGLRFMSHAKVITLKVIPGRPLLHWAKVPRLSDSLTESRTCPQIPTVSTGLLTAVEATSSMLNCSESMK